MLQYRDILNHRALSALFCGGALTGALLISGCGETESADALAGPSVQTTESGNNVGFGAALTMDSLPTELELTDEQREALARAIEDLGSARAEMRSRLEADRPRARTGGRRGGGEGNGNIAGPDRPGGPMGGALPDDFEPPMMTFVSAAAEVLDRDQFVVLAEYLVENRPDRPNHGDRRGDRIRQGVDKVGDRMADRAARDLGLSDEQVAAFRSVVSSYRDQFRDLREAVRDESMSPSDALAQAIPLAASMRAELTSLLTAEQLSTFQEHKADRVSQAIEHRLANLGERMVQRAATVAAALDMDAAQTRQVESIFVGTVAARTAVLSGLQAGSIDPEVAAFRVLVIEKDAWAEVHALLTAEQQAAWEALRDLLPAPRGGF